MSGLTKAHVDRLAERATRFGTRTLIVVPVDRRIDKRRGKFDILHVFIGDVSHKPVGNGVFEGSLHECAVWLLGYLNSATSPEGQRVTEGEINAFLRNRDTAIKDALKRARINKNPALRVSRAKGKWSRKYKDELPDSHFFIVDKRGRTETVNGYTHPLSRRHLPYIDKSGAVNLDHLKNAISRAPQTRSVPAGDRKAAQERARKLLRQIEGK